jgi:hypothetical protein
VTETFYKWLNPNRTTIYQHVKWPKRVGAWTPDETPELCKSGWHLATHQGIAERMQRDAVLWIAEGRGACDSAHGKVAFTSARLVSAVGMLTRVIAVQWAAECAQRVLKHYEDRYPNDKRPREAIDAALRWAKDPSEANRDAAAYAAYVAYVANAAHVAHVAHYAFNAAGNAAAYAAADAAAYAAYAAYVAAAAADAVAAAHYAANATHRDAQAGSDAEREWQANRLLELLGAE